MKQVIVFTGLLFIATSMAAQTTPQKKAATNSNSIATKKTVANDTTAKKKQPTGFNVAAIQQEQHTPPNAPSNTNQNSFLPKPGNEKNTSAGANLKKAAAGKKN